MTDTLVADRTAEEYQELEDRLVAKARELAPEFLAAAEEGQRVTHIPEALQQKLLDSGLYLMFVPRVFGGYEVRPRTFAKVVIELARGDMGMAWNFCLSANHALMFANWFPEEIHAEVYNNGDFRAASMYAPTVKATKVEGGYEFNGIVNYCSGIPYSTYFIGAAILEGTQADGSPRVGIYIAPKGTYEILDDWGTTLGLNSSGSNSIKFDHAFIPERFVVEDADLNAYEFTETTSPGQRAYGNAIYNARHMSSFALMLAIITIGAAYGALDEFERQMRTRKITLPPFTPRIDDPDFQRYYGGALTKISLAEAAVIHAFELWEEYAWEKTRKGPQAEGFSFQRDILLGNIGREVMIQMWEVVDADLYRTIGSSASKHGERFELIFRDMAQAVGHRNPQLKEASYRLLAQATLGVLPNA